jgi:hypothetical protein
VCAHYRLLPDPDSGSRCVLMRRDEFERRREAPRAESASAAREAAEGEPNGRPLTVMVFAPTPEARETYRRLLAGETVVSVPSWPLAVTLGSQVDCALVAVPPRAVFDATGAIHTLREEHPTLPIVCAADAGERGEIVRAGGAHEFIRFADTAAAVAAAIQAACTAALLERAAALLQGVDGMPPALRCALVHLCAADPPPRAVAELAAAVPVHRRTLWYQWRQFAGDLPLRLEDVVAWVLLLRASILRLRGSSWTEAAAALGLHRHTVARAGERLAGVRLPRATSDLTRTYAATLRRAFLSKVLKPLLRD